jgi:hypothetical protein
MFAAFGGFTVARPAMLARGHEPPDPHAPADLSSSS